MKKLVLKGSALLAFMFFVLTSTFVVAQNDVKMEADTQQEQIKLLAARKTNPTTIEIELSNHQKMLIDFYGNNILRMFQDNSGKGLRAPLAEPPTEILVKNPRKLVSELDVEDTGNKITIKTLAIQLTFYKNEKTFELKNLKTDKIVVKSIAPIAFKKDKVKIELSEDQNEYFYGGGVQNGRFSHKGKVIAIENQNSWTDGGVASPTPFYWSTNGYGFMW